MKKYSLSALVAAGLLAGGLSVTSANAADLGGNCCADLEERIAELEATTARKGNRKVSLTISGWVAEQVMYWDDGVESNTYVSGIGSTLASHVKFTGQATISPGWTAGYVLQLEATDSDALLGINQNVVDGPRLAGLQSAKKAGSVDVLQSYWFLKSDHLGKVGVGLQSQASDNTAILVDGSGSLVPANYVGFDWGGFAARTQNDGFGYTWFDIFGCNDCNGVPTNNVRYDSPTFGGFSFSASWGEDDVWDVAARYAGEFGGFKLAVAGAYAEASERTSSFILGGGSFQVLEPGSQHFQVGAYAQHIATGLFLYGAYTNFQIDDNNNSKFQLTTFTNEDVQTFYIKGGIRQRWTPLGHTVLYGEYMNGQNDAGTTFFGGGGAGGGLLDQQTEGRLFGIGVVQEIDAAAMSIWLSYRHLEGEVNSPGTFSGDFQDFDYVKAGALINF